MFSIFFLVKYNDICLFLGRSKPIKDIWKYILVRSKLKVKIILNLSTILATVAIGATGSIQLSMVMAGIWEKPFGIPFIAFGNLMLGAGVDPKKPLPSCGKQQTDSLVIEMKMVHSIVKCKTIRLVTNVSFGTSWHFVL